MNIPEQEFKRLIEKLHPLKRKYEKIFYDNQCINYEDNIRSKAAFELLDAHVKSIKEFSEKHALFFAGCSFRVYEDTYSERLDHYKTYYLESTELDFIDKEKRLVEAGFDFGSTDLKNRYAPSQRRKIKFLHRRKEEHCTHSKNRKPMSNFFVVRTLEELGVVDFLKNKGYTAQKQSKILGKILGRHHQNIREEIGETANSTNKLKKGQLEKLEKIKEFLQNL